MTDLAQSHANLPYPQSKRVEVGARALRFRGFFLPLSLSGYGFLLGSVRAPGPLRPQLSTTLPVAPSTPSHFSSTYIKVLLITPCTSYFGTSGSPSPYGPSLLHPTSRPLELQGSRPENRWLAGSRHKFLCLYRPSSRASFKTQGKQDLGQES